MNKEAQEYIDFRKRPEIREIFGDLVIAVAASASLERDTPFRDTVLKLVGGKNMAREASVLALADRLDAMRIHALHSLYQNEIRKLAEEQKTQRLLESCKTKLQEMRV